MKLIYFHVTEIYEIKFIIKIIFVSNLESIITIIIGDSRIEDLLIKYNKYQQAANFIILLLLHFSFITMPYLPTY